MKVDFIEVDRHADGEQSPNNKPFILLITFFEMMCLRVAYFIIIKEGRGRVWEDFFEAGRFSSAKRLL